MYVCSCWGNLVDFDALPSAKAAARLLHEDLPHRQHVQAEVHRARRGILQRPLIITRILTPYHREFPRFLTIHE